MLSNKVVNELETTHVPAEDDFAARVGTEHRSSSGRKLRISDLSSSGLPEEISSDEDKKLVAASPRTWAVQDDKFFSVGETCLALPPDMYNARYNQGQFYFEKRLNTTDDIVPFSDSESLNILNEIKHFQTLAPRFKELGFLFKRGIILYGPPGSGKTITVQQLTNLFIQEYKGIVLMMDNPNVAVGCMNMFRRIEPTRLILAIMEDFDELVSQYGETTFLNMLDGEGQLENVIYVATTNYPERLDKRFVDRPSRFDSIIFVGMPNEKCRKEFLLAKAPNMDKGILEELVQKSKGFSIAYMKELIIQVMGFGKSADQALDHVIQMRKNLPSSTQNPDSKGFGFSVG